LSLAQGVQERIMALKIVRGKSLPIGVDIGTTAVKMAQLRSTEEDIELLAAGAAIVPTYCREDLGDRLDTIAQNVRKILKTNAFRGREAILSLPAEATFVQHVKLPRMTPQEIPVALQVELQGKLPYPVEDAVIRFVIAGEAYGDGDPKQEIIAICTARHVLDRYLVMARKAKLDVIGVNVESCAVVECFARLFRRSSDTSRTILFIDLGAASTQVVLAHGPQIVFGHNLFYGQEVIDRAVADGMRITVEQAHAMRMDLIKGKNEGLAEDELYRLMNPTLDQLAGELTKCLRYYEAVFRNQAVERAIFVGGGAYDKRLCQMLAQRLNLPAQVGDPLVRIKRVEGAGLGIGLDRREPQPDWAVAVGLSLGAAA